MKLTRLIKTGLTALVCGAFSAPMAHAAYTTGDLLLAFRSTTVGNTTNTFVVDIGQASGYRDSTGTIDVTGALGATLNAGLTAAFGSNWATDTGLVMGVLGGSPLGGATLPGDNAGPVTYIGKAGTGSIADSLYSTPSSGTRNSMGNAVLAFANNAAGNGSFNTFVSDSANSANVYLGGNAAVIATGLNNDYTDQISATYYGLTLGGNEVKVTDSIAGTGNKSLDLVRILGTAAGATDAPSGNGVPQFQGSFSISNTGAVTFNAGVAAVPEPSRFVLLGLGVSGFLMRRRRRAAK